MGIKIMLDRGAIAALERAALPAAKEAAEALKTEVQNAAVMPFDTGDMQNNETFVASSRGKEQVAATLVTGSPQARRLYYHPEYHFQQGHNAGAGGLWLEPWIDGEERDFVRDAFVRKYRERAGL